MRETLESKNGFPDPAKANALNVRKSFELSL